MKLIYNNFFICSIKKLKEKKSLGKTEAFQDGDWEEDRERPVMYLRNFDKGTVLYFTLGHCRSVYDMQPLVEEYPELERGSWELPVFYELLRRGITWGLQG